MECTVRWTSGMTFLAETGSGHVAAMDGAPDGGGQNLAPRPMEMVLVGTGGVAGCDGVVVPVDKRQAVLGFEVMLTPRLASTEPQVLDQIQNTVQLRRPGLHRILDA